MTNAELRIDALAYGGNGVGRRPDGKTVFVPLTAPGDVVRYRPVREKKRHLEAELTEVVAPGPQRREAPCPLFGNCGGCQWQHLDYAAQLTWKQHLLDDALVRHAGLAAGSVATTVPSAEWHYRSRVQFKCFAAHGTPQIGFYRRGSHFVIPVPHCPIARPEVNRVLPLLEELLAGAPASEKIPQFDVGVGDDGRVRILCHQIGAADEAWLDSLAARLSGSGTGLFLQQGRKASLRHLTGPEELLLSIDEPALTLGYGPGGFAQVNTAQNRALVSAVVDAACLDGEERVLDLFCGMGNFSLPLARRCRELAGVEGYAPAIEQARRNARRNGIENARFLAADAAGYLGAATGGFDLVLLDPPRAGAGREVMQALQRLAPKRILYVSCDPLTLARDLAPLLHSDYRLLACRPYDLFPQTYHLESLSVLERR